MNELKDITAYYLTGLSIELEGLTKEDVNKFEGWLNGNEKGIFKISSSVTKVEKWFRKEGLAFIDVRISKLKFSEK